MRGRGGRGGGGRGRFPRWRENPDDEEEVETGERPPYPPILLPPPLEISESDNFCISKAIDLNRRFQKSPYFLKRSIEENDNIERYSDKYLRMGNDLALYDHVDLSETGHIPHELLVDIKKSVLKSIAEDQKNNVDKDEAIKSLFQRLENSESKNGNPESAMKRQESNESKDNVSEGEWDEADALDDGDYGKDYYASDEGEGDDDNEGTFD